MGRDVSFCLKLGDLELLESAPRATCGAGSGDIEADNGVLDGGGSRIGGYWGEGSFSGGG